MEFSLHTYLSHLRHDGASPDYIDTIRRNAKPLVDRDLPVILTLGQLAYIADKSYDTLLNIVKRQTDPYRIFPIRKRNGGKRYICVPEPGLLFVQRWIHNQVFRSSWVLKSLSHNVTAYVPDSSHIRNAKRHRDASWLLKFDITRFFESISERQVYQIFRELGYRALVAFCLTRLCTRILPEGIDLRLRHRTKRWQTGRPRKYLTTNVVGHLPQGAPTSPMLANLVCRKLDAELQKIADREDLTYTRYADDMTFSGESFDRSSIGRLIGEISSIVSKHGFGLNSQKTSLAKKGSRMIVTGLSVGDGIVRLPRSYKDAIRQELYYINTYGLRDHCLKIGKKNHLGYLMRLAGRIRYVETVEASAGKRMMEKFEKLFPNFREIEDLLEFQRD